MKITKEQLKKIIKEELALLESSGSQTLEEGLLDNAIQRLRTAVSRVPEQDREELQDVLATIAQLGDRAPDALVAAASAKTGMPPREPSAPGVRYTEESGGSPSIREMGRHDPDSGYDELRQQQDDDELDAEESEEDEAILNAMKKRLAPEAVR